MIHFIYIISCIPQKPVAPSNWLCTLKMIGNTCKRDATIQTQLIDNISNTRAVGYPCFQTKLSAVTSYGNLSNCNAYFNSVKVPTSAKRC